MNPNDKAQLEKVKPGWWVQTLLGRKEWFLVCAANGEYFQIWSLTDTPGVNPIHTVDTYITALHAPTDDPQMATAYKLGEPEEVTREEARKKVSVGWEWRGGPEPMWYPLHPSDFDDPDISIRLIGSPGGNVYKIRD